MDAAIIQTQELFDHQTGQQLRLAELLGALGTPIIRQALSGCLKDCLRHLQC